MLKLSKVKFMRLLARKSQTKKEIKAKGRGKLIKSHSNRREKVSNTAVIEFLKTFNLR